MTNDARIALLRAAQRDIRNAMATIRRAVDESEAADRAEAYTLLWLGKVVGRESADQDIGNIDDLIDYFLDRPT